MGSLTLVCLIVIFYGVWPFSGLCKTPRAKSRSFTALLITQRLSGYLATGSTEEESGPGYQAIGRDVRGLMPIGFLVIGSQGEEVGFGYQDIGNIGS